MSLYILDTDILSLHQIRHAAVLDRVTHHLGIPDDVLGLTVTTLDEQIDGWRSSFKRAKDNTARAAATLSFARAVISWQEFRILPTSEAAFATYERLLRMRLNVRANDLRIASVALDLGATVVTRNRRDFGRVPNLPIEDWSA